MTVRVPPRNDESPCVVFCEGEYSVVMGYAKAKAAAMALAARGCRAKVFRLVEETMYAGTGR